MKIIDLLNKIANGEEVPKKIKFSDEIFEFENGMYMSETNDYLEEYTDYTMLNNEVEIIEEDKKIGKMIKLNNVSQASDLIALNQMQHENNCIIENKINEIIDYLEEKE